MNKIVREFRWFYVTQVKQKPKSKAKLWEVVSKDKAVTWGQIRWSAVWKQYAFYSASGPKMFGVSFNNEILRHIADFITQEMDIKKSGMAWGRMPVASKKRVSAGIP